jgi:hypothetical protein
MRLYLVSLSLFAAACGAAQKPAEGSSADTSSLESPSSNTSESAPTPKATDDKPATKAATPSTSSEGTAPESSATPAAAFHPTPSANGSLEGKPFLPKIALISAAMQKDGRIGLQIIEGTDCASGKTGDASLSMLVEWKDGYKTDLGSLKRSGKKGAAEISFVRGAKPSAGFKATGTVTVVSAPTDQGATGKLKVDLQSGDYILAGDLDVLLCAAAK